MSEDKKIQWTLDVIEKLLDTGIGEQSRLLSIKDAIQNNRTVYDSDKKYLVEKFEQLNQNTKPQNSVSDVDEEQILQNIIIIVKLQNAEIGNPERLTQLKTALEQHQTLSMEDSEYLKEKYQQLQKVDNVESKIEHALQIIKKLQKEEIGNSERLESIKKTINQRKSLSNEDDVYLAEKFEQYKKINNQNTSQPKIEPSPSIPTRTYNPEFKSEGTTLVLSIVLGILGIAGVGHMYIGQVGKGVGILIGGLILLIIGFTTLMFGVGAIFLIIYLVLFIWQIIDSRKLCFYYNGYLSSNGQRPW